MALLSTLPASSMAAEENQKASSGSRQMDPLYERLITLPSQVKTRIPSFYNGDTNSKYSISAHFDALLEAAKKSLLPGMVPAERMRMLNERLSSLYLPSVSESNVNSPEAVKAMLRKALSDALDGELDGAYRSRKTVLLVAEIVFGVGNDSITCQRIEDDLLGILNAVRLSKTI